MNQKNYTIFGKSFKEKGKPNCGDYFLYNELDDEGLIVLALADGVGSKHFDDIASLTACNVFIESFTRFKTQNTKLRFEKAIKDADEGVSYPIELSHKGMMCTFAAMAWNVSENFILYASIGDSRLYRHSGKGIAQISKDSKKAVLMRDKNGKLLTQNGVLVIREGLTNALGYNGAEIKIEQEQFNPGESIVLCSDGMYEIPNFEQLLEESLISIETEKSTDKFLVKNQENYTDDATLFMLRRCDQPENVAELYRRVIKQSSDYRQHEMVAHLLTVYIQSKILSFMASGDRDEVNIYANYIEKYGLVFSEGFIEEAIFTMKSMNIYLDDFYQILIKQLRIIKR